MATTDQPVVVGVFKNQLFAERAIAELKTADFQDEQIDVAVRREFTILTVRAGERENDALAILRRTGAIEANSRFGQSADPDFIVSVMAEGVNSGSTQAADPGATGSFFERPVAPGTPGVPETPFMQESQDDPGTADDPYQLRP